MNKYAGRGFQIIGVPSNQFGWQEPASKQELKNGIKYVRPGNNFEPMFELTEKVEVNGDNVTPLYAFLKNACPVSPQQKFSQKNRLNYDTLHVSDIRWNFEKFLIGKDGKPIRRYWAGVNPSQLHNDVEEALKARTK